MKKPSKVVDLKLFRKKKQSNEAADYYKTLYNDKFLTQEESEYLLNQIQQDDKPAESLNIKYIGAFVVLVTIVAPVLIFLLVSIFQ